MKIGTEIDCACWDAFLELHMLSFMVLYDASKTFFLHGHLVFQTFCDANLVQLVFFFGYLRYLCGVYVHLLLIWFIQINSLNW